MYDLMTETMQNRYSTVAAQYYRDHIKNKVSGTNQKGMIIQQPEYEKGRERYQMMKMITPQVVQYNSLNCSKILVELLKKNGDLDQNYK